MYLCDRCQKGLQVGMNVSHSHRRTKKRSLPNLHVVTVKIDGNRQTFRLCTKCIRIVREAFPRVAEDKTAEKVEKKTPVKAEKAEEVKEETPEVVSQEA